MRVLQCFVKNNDIVSARERVEKERKEGETLCDNLEHVKTFTAGKMVVAGSYRLSKDVFNLKN